MAKPDNHQNKRLILVTDFDYIIFFTVILLVLVGIVMVFSASYYYGGTSKQFDNDMYYFVKRQGIAALVGLASMLFMANFHYKHLSKLSWIPYVVAVVGLVLVLFLGEKTNGATRWIAIPVFGSFQPSEVAKIAVILVLANIISADKNMFKSLRGYIKCGIIIGIPIILIAIGKNLSTVLIIAIIGGGLIFIASPYFWRYIFMVAGAAGALLAYLNFVPGYHHERYLAFLDPWKDPLKSGYQVIQSMYAVASGGLFGLGLGQSRQKLGYVPEAYNDIIFSILCEELGFIGACFVLFLFAILIWRGIRTALNAPDLFGTLVAAGIVIQIGVQVVINVGVVTNSIPNTGIPMPFISYGGTAILFNLFSMGILLNISRYSRKKS